MLERFLSPLVLTFQLMMETGEWMFTVLLHLGLHRTMKQMVVNRFH